MRRLRTRFRTSNGGAGGRFPFPDQPTLILDFVPIADPVNGDTLAINFASSSYEVNVRDPIAPTALLNIQVWN